MFVFLRADENEMACSHFGSNLLLIVQEALHSAPSDSSLFDSDRRFE